MSSVLVAPAHPSPLMTVRYRAQFSRWPRRKLTSPLLQMRDTKPSCCFSGGAEPGRSGGPGPRWPPRALLLSWGQVLRLPRGFLGAEKYSSWNRVATAVWGQNGSASDLLVIVTILLFFHVPRSGSRTGTWLHRPLATALAVFPWG